MRILVGLGLLFVSILLVGCGPHTPAYLKHSHQIPHIVVPKDVPVVKEQPYYPIPHVAFSRKKPAPALLPPTLKKH